MDRETWAPEFRARFERHEEELRWLFMELYHNDEQAYEYFADMLCRAYEQRSEALRAIDNAKLSDPDWYKGNKLVGIISHVDELKRIDKQLIVTKDKTGGSRVDLVC